ncbi:MAG: acetyl-CoA carboxylase biotin carboxyl carrier protein [Planctomycetota bacterium]
MLELDRIRQLVEMMVANDLIELSLRDGEVEVNLRRPNPKSNEAPVLHAVHSAAHPNPPAPPEAKMAGEVVEVEFYEIRSPMVGTFYASPDPDSPPFVEVGGNVEPSTVVCILEAMKVFSEIKAETTGTVERVLVRDGEAVEYGQPLLLVRPH